MENRFYYTTAPKGYDGFGTKTVGTGWVWVSKLDGDRKPVRKVSTPCEHFEWQSMRYRSGAYPTWTEEQFREEELYGYIQKGEK